MTHDERRARLCERFCLGLTTDELEEYEGLRDWIWSRSLRLRQQSDQLDARREQIESCARVVDASWAGYNRSLADLGERCAQVRAAWLRVRNAARALLAAIVLVLVAHAVSWLDTWGGQP